MNFVWKPDLGAKKSIEPSVSTVKFNDDYEARIPNSINSGMRKWDCTFTTNLADANAIDTFFIQANGVTAFNWIDPQGKSGLFVCRKHQLNQLKFGVYQISATFEEVQN